ncbi:SPOR domain-containing protein [Aliiroseovarius sp.]|uniref:SPOR domain-containing protein n=1 Tax=Aliiroseovarius sp. TaxID=1872442 RepID=UPI00263871E3|nr:SPOR domain-containing protein [Aliiroseovarius sp.]
MAQVDWDAQMQPGGIHPDPQAHHQDGNPRRGRVPLTSLAGAVLSVGLLAGVGVWGYELAMRDVTGVPVVRALEGPMRVQPADPGGTAAEHQGLAVNAVAAEGGAARPADTLTLAPQAAELTAEDSPANPNAAAAVAAAPMPGRGAGPENLASASDLAVLAALETDGTEGATQALAGTLADSLSETTAASRETTTAPSSTEAVAVAPEATSPAMPDAQNGRIADDVPGVRRSPRPIRRPAALAIAASVSVSARGGTSPSTAPVANAAAMDEIDPTSLPAGTRLVQLGAFDSPQVARSEWVRLAARFEDYMGGKTRVIEEAQSGGKTFYRLRAHGFADLSDARRFCSALLAEKAACIPVMTR